MVEIDVKLNAISQQWGANECSISVGSDCNIVGNCDVYMVDISLGVKEVLLMIGT